MSTAHAPARRMPSRVSPRRLRRVGRWRLVVVPVGDDAQRGGAEMGCAEKKCGGDEAGAGFVALVHGFSGVEKREQQRDRGDPEKDASIGKREDKSGHERE